MNPFVEIDFKDKVCVECGNKFDKNETGVHLQCECSIHSKCIKKICENKFGEEMNLWTIDKRNLFNVLEKLEEKDFFIDLDNANIFKRTNKDSYNIMCLGTEETDGVIKCPKCNLEYSILSPIYRDFGIPKVILSIIFFKDNDKEKLLSYHICTNIDTIHLLSYPKQKNILNIFKYDEENKWNYLLNKKLHLEIKNLGSGYYHYHAVIVKETNFVFFNNVECPVCCKKLNDDLKYRHSTINDFMIHLQKTKKDMDKYIWKNSDSDANSDVDSNTNSNADSDTNSNADSNADDWSNCTSEYEL
jgi:uncharacterized protein (UPF0212 family)